MFTSKLANLLRARILAVSVHKRNTLIGYSIALALPGVLFFASWKMVGESEAIFVLLYLFSALLVTVFEGARPGILAGIVSTLAVDYHYIQPLQSIFNSSGSIVFFGFTLILIQSTLAIIRLIQNSLEAVEFEKQRSLAAIISREEILSIVAHDLRQPLSSINMRAELILNSGANSLTHSHSVGIIKDIAQINRMITDLIDFAKVDSAQLSVHAEPCHFRSLLDSAIESFRLTHPNVLIVTYYISNPTVLADSDCTQRILINLISNAIKYGSPFTEIGISVKEHSGYATVSVNNIGKGIPENQLSTIFERFSRTTEAKTGSVDGLGLGLYITKGMVEAQGGKIWAKSVLNLETSFNFTIPLSTKPISDKITTKKNSEQPSEKPLDGIAVLVVDDCVDSSVLLRTLLERSGALVTTSNSVENAMLSLVESIPDVVVTDIEMPEADGFELLRRIREFQTIRQVHFPIIAFTGHTGLNEAKKIELAGFDSKISKPVVATEFIQSVCKAIGVPAQI